MPRIRFAPSVPGFAIHTALGLQAGLLLYAAGRPLFTDDLWWHLSLGRAFLKRGPGLDADPSLHTAPGPPDSASWLGDVALTLVQQGLGFHGLRVFHVLAVAAILALAWLLLRRASGSRLLASLGTGCFAALAAYRLFQLRPGLFSIFAALALSALLMREDPLPSRRRVMWAALLTGFWANLHAGFALGPILLLAAALGVAVNLPLLPAAARQASRARVLRLFEALAACVVASLANPKGFAAYFPYLRAGGSTPELGLVFDEWSPFALFQFPAVDTQPTPLTFVLLWFLLVSSVLSLSVVGASVLRKRRPEAAGLPWDPALMALSAVAFCAALLAVRFLWLGVFPLLFVFDMLRRGSLGRQITCHARTRWGLAALSWLLVFAFLRMGDWPFMSRGVPTTWTGYSRPYTTSKYHLHATWFLQDTGLSGKLYHAYFQGGFLGFWLSPELQTFVDGSLNVAPGVMRDYSALQTRSGLSEEGFLDLLDRYEIDLFFGVGLPTVQHPNRPWRYTAAHLEGAEGWIPIFRSARSAVYLRDVPRNAENLSRVARYYETQGVPFDAIGGFEAGGVVAGAPGWASRFGLLPRDFRQASVQQFSADAKAARDARERLSAIFALLGLYERVVRLEERTLAHEPLATSSRRRLIWALLRSGRISEALAQTRKLGAAEELDPITHFVAESAREIAALEDPASRAERIALLPVFYRAEANWHVGRYIAPELRDPTPGMVAAPSPEPTGADVSLP